MICAFAGSASVAEVRASVGFTDRLALSSRQKRSTAESCGFVCVAQSVVVPAGAGTPLSQSKANVDPMETTSPCRSS